LLRPDVVWFDEAEEESEKIEAYFSRTRTDLTLVVGTEATFSYVRSYALRSRANGAFLTEINPRSTLLTDAVDIHISGLAGQVLSRLQ
jgi:NAD-dependent SIR2 family protein deacetylase